TIRASLLSWPTLAVTAITLCTWIALLGWSFAKTVQQDDEAAHTLRDENSILTRENDQLKQRLAEKPKEVLRIERVPVPDIEDARRRERTKQVRATLGAFLGRCQYLMRACGDEASPAPESEANSWAQEVEIYLEKNLGPEYIPRFRSEAGVP